MIFANNSYHFPNTERFLEITFLIPENDYIKLCTNYKQSVKVNNISYIFDTKFFVMVCGFFVLSENFIEAIGTH